MKTLSLIFLATVMLLLSTFAFTHATETAPVGPVQNNVTVENDTNRPGSDYRDFEIQADPAICRNACANDATCRAYTYVKPGVQGQSAHCWLKNSAPNASANNCCVSGVKSNGDAAQGLEVNVNRRGGDYQDFELRSNNPYECRDACSNDARCASFTYVRPSFFGQYSHCFLKSSVPGAAQEGCCISGVVRAGGGGGGGRNTGGTPIAWNENPLISQRGRDKNGDRYKFYCPANGPDLKSFDSRVYGTDKYSDDSPICVAAIHAGLITLQSGGTVSIQVQRPGEAYYRGSTQNGIASRDYDNRPNPTAGSFWFIK
jgi:hypothetical protein